MPTEKDTINKIKKLKLEWDRIYAIYTTDKMNVLNKVFLCIEKWEQNANSKNNYKWPESKWK